jgi:hypothetical protein
MTTSRRCDNGVTLEVVLKGFWKSSEKCKKPFTTAKPALQNLLDDDHPWFKELGPAENCPITVSYNCILPNKKRVTATERARKWRLRAG